MKYQYWFMHLPYLYTQEYLPLFEVCQSAEEIYHLPDSQLKTIPDLSPKVAEKIRKSRKNYDLDEEYGRFAESGIGLVTRFSKDFPQKLLSISNPPLGLFYKGSLPEKDQRLAAIVGARERSSYGQSVAELLAKRLAEKGFGIVSGMAGGIDGDAHRGALEGKGKTYGVLGAGVDVCYPVSNRRLYQTIPQAGGLLSEYLPGTQPLAAQFPLRNRIISGISDFCIVVEARKKSGSLITADYALEQGRDVYAVPGRLGDPLSQGTNYLIKQGAGILWDIEDFLKDLQIADTNVLYQMDFHKNLLEKEELLVYSFIDFCPVSVGNLMDKTELPLMSLLELIGSLEDKGFIKEKLPGYYVKSL